MKSKPSLAVLIIHDQRAGHLNPSLGVYDNLETAYSTTLYKIVTPTLKKWQISLLKKLVGIRVYSTYLLLCFLKILF